MAKKKAKFARVTRDFSDEERQRHNEIREQAMQEFPPAEHTQPPSPPGIPATMRAAREARGLSWYALAKQAGVPNSNTVRDIEQGKDVRLSSVQAVAKALGLSIELVEQG